MLLSLQYYPQSWMLQYLDVAVNLVDQSVSLSNIYIAKDCGDDYAVKFWWYGSKTICYEYGDVKYETCSEDSTGLEISGFMPTVIEQIIKDKLQLCTKHSTLDSLTGPLRFEGDKYSSEGKFISEGTRKI